MYVHSVILSVLGIRVYTCLSNNILYHLLGGNCGPQKTSIMHARISPQTTNLIAIEYGLYVLLLLLC